jgi:hypothetical protein
MDFIMVSREMINLKAIENSIYLAVLPPLPKGAPKRKKRPVTPLRRKWLDTLRLISFPFFNENQPKSTGNIPIDAILIF